MLAASAAERVCFALIPIGTGAIPIGIRAKSIGIGAFPVGTGAIPIGIGAIPIGIGAFSIGIRAIPIGIRPIPAGTGPISTGIVSIPIGIRAIPIDFAPVPIGIRAMQTRFQLPLRAFSRSKAVPQRMTRRSAWLRKQKPPAKAAGCNSCKSSKQRNPQEAVTTQVVAGRNLG
jgi:hypothetical protein